MTASLTLKFRQFYPHLKTFYYFHLVQLYKSASEAPEPIPCRPEALYSWLPSAKTSLNPFPWRLENPGSVFRLKHDFLPCSLSFPHLPLFPAPQYSSPPQAFVTTLFFTAFTWLVFFTCEEQWDRLHHTYFILVVVHGHGQTLLTFKSHFKEMLGTIKTLCQSPIWHDAH